ncbi:MAG TPA: hypothetical protein VIE12_04185 [Actinomycetota bacterium]|jgi:hypothetical protein
MFARYFVEIPLSTERVEHLLTLEPDSWLPGLAEHANRRGDELLADVGFGEKIRVAREVAITVGAPVRAGTKTLLPLRWVPSGGAGLFPSLDADLEIAPLGPGRVQLAMSARYAPPLKAVGRVIDRVVLFRVAEATLKDFLDGVAEAVMALEHAGAPIGEASKLTS